MAGRLIIWAENFCSCEEGGGGWKSIGLVHDTFCSLNKQTKKTLWRKKREEKKRTERRGRKIRYRESKLMMLLSPFSLSSLQSPLVVLFFAAHKTYWQCGIIFPFRSDLACVAGSKFPPPPLPNPQSHGLARAQPTMHT